ncbi:AAA family ATPase [candidate division GN15 bacterium]|nr:AAA family ATPase [candidate division GN15 bacterium]
MSMRYRLVITGAPASGKTEFFDRLAINDAFEAFVFLPELARRLLEDNPGFRTDREAFHREIYRRQIAREDELGEKSFVTDRGTVDAFAFHPETAELVGTTIEREYERYDAVIQLGSAAGLGPGYYRTDTIRLESIDEALEIEKAIQRVWRDHPGFHYLPARINYQEKYERLLELVLHLTGQGKTIDNSGIDSSV